MFSRTCKRDGGFVSLKVYIIWKGRLDRWGSYARGGEGFSRVTGRVIGVDEPDAAGSRGMEESLRYSNMILVIFTIGRRRQRHYEWYPTRTIDGLTNPYYYLAYSVKNSGVVITYLLTPKHLSRFPPPPPSSHSPWAISSAVSSLLCKILTACSSQCALLRSTLIRFL